MTEKQFINSLANGQSDIIQQFIDLLKDLNISYCVVGGLAVNAFVEPVVSLDLDFIVAVDSLTKLKEAAEKDFSIREFPHSLKLTHPQSNLRIQLQLDPRYQSFIKNAARKKVLGYDMEVASLEDVLQGKIWAYLDVQRRSSKRQKDLADIFRLVETYPNLSGLLPESIKKHF
jgi:hypothetical protein